ncbi:TetR/AcrR family transcriptional regulator [Streptomyces sp. NPDC055140]
MRADAQRNRQRILETAREVFSRDGLSVPVAEIARRAGVGTGTVSRHFPTKESLYEAIARMLTAELADEACRLADTRDPAEAFFDFFAYLVDRVRKNRGLTEGMSGAGFDIPSAVTDESRRLAAAEAALLAAAQRAGSVRADLAVADMRALMVGCVAREQDATDPKVRRRMIDIASTGMRPKS